MRVLMPLSSSLFVSNANASVDAHCYGYCGHVYVVAGLGCAQRVLVITNV